MKTSCPFLSFDGYKAAHREQYPDKTEFIYANMTPRKSRLKNIDYAVFFGLQYFIKEYLIDRCNNDFFSQPIGKVIDKYKKRISSYLNKQNVYTEHFERLHTLGYMPLKIKALPEGTRCSIKVPMCTVINTDKEFFWLTNQIETLMSCTLWLGCTSATIADNYRQAFDYYNKMTGIDPTFSLFQGHDFSFRGMGGLEAACISGAGHLTSFVGTDTIPAIDFIEEYYGCDGLIGASVNASEHSVVSAGGSSEEDQVETLRRLITKVYPTGIFSFVSDTFDYWTTISETAKLLKPEIMARDGKLVFRPDSGDPVKMIVGDPEAEPGSLEYKGSYQVLAEIFGTTKTSKGYNQLDNHVGLIYGDSITIERQEQILRGLTAKGFAPDVVLGIGSFSYQYNTRDTLGFAVKATWAQIDGKPKDIFKAPKTDKGGEKKSAKGLVMVDNDLVLHDQCSWEEENMGILRPVFENGKLLVDEEFNNIRERLHPTK